MVQNNKRSHNGNKTIDYLLRNISGRLKKLEDKFEEIQKDRREEIRAMVEGMINAKLEKVEEKKFNFWIYFRDKVSPAILIVIALEILKLIPR